MGIMMRLVSIGEMGVPCGSPPSRKHRLSAVFSAAAPSGRLTTSLNGKILQIIFQRKVSLVLPKKSEKSVFRNQRLLLCWCRLTASIVQRPLT